MLRRVIISLLFLLLSLSGMAQSVTNKAIRHYQNDKLKEAERLIDSAITLEKEKQDPYTWQVRGFVYKSLFKKSEGKTRDKHRDVAIEAFQKALEKGAEGRVKDASRKSLTYMARSTYNDAMKRLDTSRTEGPFELYERYLSLMDELGVSEQELKKDRISFLNRLGTTYMTLYESKRGHDQTDFGNAIDAFGKVLAIDSSNYLANYNTGILYYNRGVQIAQKADPGKMEVELKKVKELQKKSTKVFKKALPFMKAAHEQRPKRIETLEGLSGIYYSLNEDEKVERYRKKKKKILKEKR